MRTEQEKNAFEIKLASSDDDELRSLLDIKLNHIKDRMGSLITNNNFPSEIVVHQIRDYSRTKMHLLNEDVVQEEARIILKLCKKVTKKILNSNNCTFPLVARTMSEIVHNCIRGDGEWNLDILQLYFDDSLSGRLWVDSTENCAFVQTIQYSIECLRNSYAGEDKLGLCNRFHHCSAKLEELIMQNIVPKLQEPSSMFLNHLLLTLLDLVILPQVRLLVSNSLEQWLNNPAIIDNVKKLIIKLVDCIELRKKDKSICDVKESDTTVVENIVKLRNLLMKTTTQMDLYKTIVTTAVQKSYYLAKLVVKLLIEQDVSDGYSRAANTRLVSSLYLIIPLNTASQVLGELMNEIIQSYAIKFTTSNYSVFAKNILDELAKLCRAIGLKNIEIKIFLRGLFPEDGHESLVATYFIHDFKLKHLYFALMGEVFILLQLLFSQEIVAIEKEVLSNKDKLILSSLSAKKPVVLSLFIDKSVKLANKLSSATKSGSTIDSIDNQLRRESIFLIQEVACTWISSICIVMYSTHFSSIVNSNDRDVDNSWFGWVEKVTNFLKGVQSFNFEYDKIALSNLYEVGGASDSMLVSLINMAAALSATSKTNTSLWIGLIYEIVQRAMQRHNIFDVNDVNIIHRLFSLTCLTLRTNNCDNTVDSCLFNTVQNNWGLFHQPTKDMKPHRCKNIHRKVSPFLPPIADKWLYWKVSVLCYLLGCGSPGTLGKFLWKYVPNIKNLMLMTLSSRFDHTLSNVPQNIDLNDSVLLLHSHDSYIVYHSDCKGTLMITKEKVDPINNSDVFEESIIELESKLHKYLFEPINDEIQLRSSSKMKRKLSYLEEQRQDEEERIERREREKNARAERAAARSSNKQFNIIPITRDKADEHTEMQVDEDDNVTNSEEIESTYIVPELRGDSPSPYLTQFHDVRFSDDEDKGIVFLNFSGLPRRPPIDVIEVIKKLDCLFNFGSTLRMCVNPDFIESTLLGSDNGYINDHNSSVISREVIEKSKFWLLPTIGVDTSILSRLPAVTHIHILSISSYSIWNFCEKYQLWDAKEAYLFGQQDFYSNMSLMCKLTLQLKAEMESEIGAEGSELMQSFFGDIYSYRREVRIATRITLNTLLSLLQLDIVGAEVQSTIFRILQQRKYYQCDYNSLCNLLPVRVQNILIVSLVTSLYVEGDILASFDILAASLIPAIHKICYFSTRPLQINAMICNDELCPRLQLLFVEIADCIIGCIQRGEELKGVVALKYDENDTDYNFLSTQKLYVSKNALRFMLHGYHLYVKLMANEDGIVLEEGQVNDSSDNNIRVSLLEVLKTVKMILDVARIEDTELLQLFTFSFNFTSDVECRHFINNLPINVVSKLFLKYHAEFTHKMLACMIVILGSADCGPAQGNIATQVSLRATFRLLASKFDEKEYEVLSQSPILMSLFDADIPQVQCINPIHVQLAPMIPIMVIPILEAAQSRVDMPIFQRNDIDIESVLIKAVINDDEGLTWDQKFISLIPFISRSSLIAWDNLLKVLRMIKSKQLHDSDVAVTAFLYLTLKHLTGTNGTSFISALDTIIDYLITLRIESSILQQKIDINKYPLLSTYFAGINTVQSLVDSTIALLSTNIGSNTDFTTALTILRDKRWHYFKSKDLVTVENKEEGDGSYLLQHLVYNIYLQFPLDVSRVFCSNDEDKYNFHWHMISLQRFASNNFEDSRYDDSTPSKRRCSLKTTHPYSDALTSAPINQESLDVDDYDGSLSPVDHVFTLSLITLFNSINSKMQNIKYLDSSDGSASYTDLNEDVDTARIFVLSMATEHPTMFMRHINHILRDLRVSIVMDKSLAHKSDLQASVFDAEFSNREHIEIDVKFMNTSEYVHLIHVINDSFIALTPYLDKADPVAYEIRSIIDSMM